MSEKKFANLHYPGMKADPTESGNKRVLPPDYLWRFESQMAVLGEIAQRKILDTSVLILGSTPLGVTIAKKVLRLGVGRLGIFSDEPITGAHGLGKPENGETSAIKKLGKLMKSEFPWAEFEPFSTLSVDRQLDDILRGFKIVISVLHGSAADEAADICKEASLAFLKASVHKEREGFGNLAELTAVAVAQKIFEHAVGIAPLSSGSLALDQDAFGKLAQR